MRREIWVSVVTVLINIFDYLPTEEQDDYDSDEEFDYLLGEESDESGQLYK